MRGISHGEECYNLPGNQESSEAANNEASTGLFQAGCRGVAPMSEERNADFRHVSAPAAPGKSVTESGQSSLTLSISRARPIRTASERRAESEIVPDISSRESVSATLT